MLDLFWDICAFCQAVFTRWVELALGGVVAAAWFIYCQVTERDVPMKAFYWIISVCFLMAIFGAWREAHTARRKNAEGMRGDIPKFGMGYIENGPVVIYPLVAIYNLGPPSIAEDFKATITIDGKPVIRDLQPSILAQNISFEIDGSKLQLKPSEMLFEKAATPIPQGGRITGWLVFIVEGWTFEALRGKADVTVSFKDVLGTTYHAAGKPVGEPTRSHSHQYIPGVDDPFVGRFLPSSTPPSSTPSKGASPP